MDQENKTQEHETVYVGTRISREMHTRLMEEKIKRKDRVTQDVLIVEALGIALKQWDQKRGF